MSLDPVRRHALDTLLAVAKGELLEPALAGAIVAVSSAAGDHSPAFLAELVKGTLRWQGRYDWLIKRFSRRRAPTDPRLLMVLRLSLHQLIACDGVPAYAAIHQGGELCRAVVSARSVPYVNGLLQAVRRALAAAPSGHSGQSGCSRAFENLFPDRQTETVAHLQTYHSFPRWLVERWLDRFGLAGCERLLRHHNQPPPLTFHVLPPAALGPCRERLIAAGIAVAPGRWNSRALQTTDRLPRDELAALLKRFPELIIQDEGAQCATDWLAVHRDGRLLDCCAAPGGKTLHLRASWSDPTDIVAMDLSRDGLQRLLQNTKRIEAYPLSMVLASGAQPPFAAESFATVLLDGPCSGSGVLRHHPEGRWRLRPRTLRENGERLFQLAERTLDLLRPGGELLYVTCSLEPEENGDVIDRLRRAHPELEPAVRPGPGPHRYQRAWLPQRTGTDGFFAARLRKKGTSA
ncbi:MAG: transcription antitermination factor NusB [bacterium]